MTKLSILIATTVDRRPLFDKLLEEFIRQIHQIDNMYGGVELLYEEDNKEISIGKKRQRLLERSTGEYVVYFDSDDFPMHNYTSEIMTALQRNVDCVGFLIHMTTNSKNPQVCCHSLRYKVWAKNKNGYNYVRGCTHFNPIKREIALRVGFNDLRYGEDKIYSDAVTRLCKTEAFINKKLFHYRYSNAVPHTKKYGIK